MNQSKSRSQLHQDPKSIWNFSPDFPGERLIACFNPYTKERSQHRREDLLQTTERHLQRVLEATQRKTTPLRGASVARQKYVDQ
jgi:hypothetical protein